MRLCDINPFLRYAGLQPSVLSTTPDYYSYDYRIFYVIDGSCNFVCLGERHPISAGTLVYFRPATPYYFDGKVKVIVLNFDMTRLNSDKSAPHPPSIGLEAFDEGAIIENDPPLEFQDPIILEKALEVEDKMQESLIHYSYPKPYSDTLTSSILKEILCYIAQRTDSKSQEPCETVQEIMLYISKNYDREISNTEISKELGYHSFYLNRFFKKETGITIH